jgi:putative spermidine/putrescine transport system substrate-binding protein
MRNPFQGRHRAGSRALAAAAAVALVAFGALACSAPKTGGSKPAASSTGIPEKPSSPVTLNVVDVAGNLQLTQGIFDNFVKEHPDIISKVTTSKETAPNLPGKLKAQQDANNIQIDLVLTGTDALSNGITQNLWLKVSDFESRLPNMQNYTPIAKKMQELAQGQAVEVVEYPSGPLTEYNPAKVTAPPKTPQELLDWAKAHPGKYAYAVPRNSGPGRTWLMGLPYLLGDSDPKNPETGWEKTWAYLTELGKYITYYPSGTTENMTNLAKGTVDLVASTTGWYLNPIILGTVPKTMKAGFFDKFTWVADAQYMAIPKGVSNDKVAAILQFMNYALDKKQQPLTIDKGYFYPGPAVSDVTLDQAPQASQDAIKAVLPPEFDPMIKNMPMETSLPADVQVKAFAKWDQLIAGGKVKK